MEDGTKPVTGDDEQGIIEENGAASGLSRRDVLKAGGAAAAGAMFFGAMGSDVAGAATSGSGAPPWKQADYLNFARLVNAAWKNPGLRTQYHNDPTKVLKQYGITLPAGTPPPTIPAKPANTALGTATTGSKAFKAKATSSAANWDLHISHLSGPGIAISSLACIACPVSSFSSLSNG